MTIDIENKCPEFIDDKGDDIQAGGRSILPLVKKFLLWVVFLPIIIGLDLMVVCGLLNKSIFLPGVIVELGLYGGVGISLATFFMNMNDYLWKILFISFINILLCSLIFKLIVFTKSYGLFYYSVGLVSGVAIGIYEVFKSNDKRGHMDFDLITLILILILILANLSFFGYISLGALNTLNKWNFFFSSIVGFFTGIFLGLIIGIIILPVLNLMVYEIKKPLLYFKLLWRPFVSFTIVYLLLIIFFALIYNVLYQTFGNELFYYPGKDTGARLTFGDFAYFSTVTIATLGYGDIYATTWLSRAIASIEVVVGMGWIVVYFTLMMKYYDSKLNTNAESNAPYSS